jgi:hypothetical protein
MTGEGAIMTQRSCTNCGVELGEEHRFCPSCGRPAHETATVPTVEADIQVPPLPSEQSGRKRNAIEAFKQASPARRLLVAATGGLGVLAVLMGAASESGAGFLIGRFSSARGVYVAPSADPREALLRRTPQGEVRLSPGLMG